MNKRETRIENLGRGMIIVLVANIISMLFNFLINILQPKYLSVDSYAAVKTFTLYLSITGIFHLGYADGTYLHYGGKEKKNINKEELGRNISTLRIFQLATTTILLIAGMISDDTIILLSACMLLPYNMVMHFRLFYQAVGDFKHYGRVMNWSTALIFIGNVLLIFAFHVNDFKYYLFLQVAVYLIIWIVLEADIRKSLNVKAKILDFSMNEFVINLRSGFLIMVGNFSSIFLTTLDRWFVKYLLVSMDFAQYSFAVSMEGFLNVAVSPFTTTLYNYFCNEKRNEQIKNVHNSVLIFAVTIVAVAFSFKFIVEHWLQSYLNSVHVSFILFASQILFIVIKSIYVNLYKARKEQKKYFAKLMIVLVSGAVFNALCFLLLRVKEAMAIGTLMSATLWFALCQSDFKDIRFDAKHYMYMVAEIALFLACGLLMNSVMGFGVYVLGTVFLSMTMVRKDMLLLFNYGMRVLKPKGLKLG